MPAITNHYRDSHVLNLGSGDERGPYLVTQTGVAPSDAFAKERMFVLRPDGRWVDFNAYACQEKPDAMDEIVFFHHDGSHGSIRQIDGPPSGS